MDATLTSPAPDALAIRSEDAQWCRDISARIHSGDSLAESELITRFEPGLRVVLRRAVGANAELVRDLCQETLLIVLQRLRTRPLEDPARLAAFAAQTARNLAIAYYRKSCKRSFADGDEILPWIGDAAPRPLDRVGVNAAVQAVHDLLPELQNQRDRELLERVYVRDQDKSTVCRDMDLPEAHFHKILSRARCRFRELLDLHGYQKRDFL